MAEVKYKVEGASVVLKTVGYARGYKCIDTSTLRDIVVNERGEESMLTEYFAEDCVIAVLRDSYNLYVLTVVDSTEFKTTLVELWKLTRTQ